MWQYNQSSELCHFGVPGMRWGARRASNKAVAAKASAKEWDQIANYKKSQGKTKAAAKYKTYAEKDRVDAAKYNNKAKVLSISEKKQSPNTGVKKSKVKTAAKVGVSVVAGLTANKFGQKAVYGLTGSSMAATVAGASLGVLGGTKVYDIIKD